MKYLSFLLVVILISTSCNKSAKQLKERIVNADSIAINYFKGDGTMDTVTAVKIVRDRKTIDHLIDLVTTKGRGEVNKCGYDGSLHFFKMNRVIQDIDFRFNEKDGCDQFTFLLGGKYGATAVSTEARELLLKLKVK